jgi:hypothetical protein
LKTDPVLEEVYRNRDELAKKFGFDVSDLGKAMKASENRSNKHRVKPQPRRVGPVPSANGRASRVQPPRHMD